MKKEIYQNPFFKANPVTVLVLGICSSLAVTVKLEPACVMALSVTFVTGFSSLFASLLRNTIPNRIRIIVQLVLVSLFVILIDQFLKAYAYDVSKQLSVYVGLIITNCIIMGRIEAFALSGTLFGHQIIPVGWYEAGYMNNGLIILPPMALILVGLFIWLQRGIQKDLIEK